MSEFSVDVKGVGKNNRSFKDQGTLIVSDDPEKKTATLKMGHPVEGYSFVLTAETKTRVLKWWVEISKNHTKFSFPAVIKKQEEILK